MEWNEKQNVKFISGNRYEKNQQQFTLNILLPCNI